MIDTAKMLLLEMKEKAKRESKEEVLTRSREVEAVEEEALLDIEEAVEAMVTADTKRVDKSERNVKENKMKREYLLVKKNPRDKTLLKVDTEEDTVEAEAVVELTAEDINKRRAALTHFTGTSRKEELMKEES